MAEQATVWKMAALSGVAFGVLFAAGFGLLEGWLPPRDGFHVLAICAAALVAGTAFGAAMGLFAGSKVVARQTSIDLPQGEVVEHGGPANHFHNFGNCSRPFGHAGIGRGMPARVRRMASRARRERRRAVSTTERMSA